MRTKRQPLVCKFLEHVSTKYWKKNGRHLGDLVGKSHGVYSLYKGGRLYYVGLASNIPGRLDQHLRDPHKGLWDNFSVYLTLESGFMKELESLVLRIAEPKGNKQGGNFVKAQDLRKMFDQRIDDKARSDREAGYTLHRPKPRKVAVEKSARKGKGVKKSSRVVVLAKYPGRPKSLRKVFKGKKYTAQVRRDGTIKVRGIAGRFNSPSLAAMAIAKRTMNGWSFWTYQQAPGKWSSLNALRQR